tara:strand:+ start:46 stop:297 length:252 start_codon:yes stop_codon:yes gene_type:complete
MNYETKKILITEKLNNIKKESFTLIKNDAYNTKLKFSYDNYTKGVELNITSDNLEFTETYKLTKDNIKRIAKAYQSQAYILQN